MAGRDVDLTPAVQLTESLDVEEMTPDTEAASLEPEPAAPEVVFAVKELDVYYGSFRAVRDVNINVHRNEITAFIGPSGCGKTTVLRCFNRMNDLIDIARVEGKLTYHGVDLYDREVNPVEVRRRIGMVFQKPNPFPKSIYENVAYGPKVAGTKGNMDDIVERALTGAGLWDEVKSRLKASGMGLSGGQQQRLCIARAIAAEPEILLLDEPCSALDPIATNKVEDLVRELRGDYSIVIVTHNMQQASRVSDYTAFMYLGRLIEFGPTADLFTRPKLSETEAYVTGRFGCFRSQGSGVRGQGAWRLRTPYSVLSTQYSVLSTSPNSLNHSPRLFPPHRAITG